ncbi:hypothetical protein ColKHC_00844 [Colletotrichum higginsianum]|nr:hypothetical protein ColKHC_00844 [Colletotrichum higginsianum]
MSSRSAQFSLRASETSSAAAAAPTPDEGFPSALSWMTTSTFSSSRLCSHRCVTWMLALITSAWPRITSEGSGAPRARRKAGLCRSSQSQPTVLISSCKPLRNTLEWMLKPSARTKAGPARRRRQRGFGAWVVGGVS